MVHPVTSTSHQILSTPFHYKKGYAVGSLGHSLCSQSVGRDLRPEVNLLGSRQHTNCLLAFRQNQRKVVFILVVGFFSVMFSFFSLFLFLSLFAGQRML